MAASHGKEALFKITSGGTSRDISSYLDSTGLAREIEQAETSGLGTDDKSFIPGMAGATIPLSGFFDPTTDGYIETIRANAAAGGTAWEFYPAGSASDLVKYSGSAYVAKYDIETGVDGVGKISGELQVTGAITRATL